MSASSEFSVLPWDSDFFGCRIARVDASCFGAQSAQSLLATARSEGIDCLYLLIDAGSTEQAHAAARSGFELVDVRVTREIEAPASEAFSFPENVGLCQPEDLPHLRAIARDSHQDSRFYYDPSFPNERCDDLYETWIENSCNGGAAGVVVARSGGAAVGYVTCEIPEEGLGNLGLVAVARGAGGQGHGGRMVRGALGWLGAQGCARIQVVTQARNVNAARLYEAHGFRTIRVESSYHLWLSREESG